MVRVAGSPQKRAEEEERRRISRSDMKTVDGYQQDGGVARCQHNNPCTPVSLSTVAELASLPCRGTLLQESTCALRFVLGCAGQPEERRFQLQPSFDRQIVAAFH